MLSTPKAPSNTKPDIDRLTNEYSQYLTRLCYIILRDIHLAEKAAWDTLFSAYKNYNTFKKGNKERTWITKIAVTICRNYMKKSSYKKAVISDFMPFIYASGDELTTEFRSKESVNLLNSIYNLSDNYRIVILLRYYSQMSIPEIAYALCEFEFNISKRLDNAETLLRKRLMEE